MSRPALVCFGAAALGLLALSFAGDMADRPAWLALWLLVLALPLGALPLVLGAASVGTVDRPVLAALRSSLALMPVAAVLVIPVLVHWALLYPPPPDGAPGLVQAWTAPATIKMRTVVMLTLWTLLALMYWRPSGTEVRRRLAPLGLVLHVVMSTIAAGDWIGALDPGLNASSLGVLVMLSQCGLAYAVAGLLAAGSGSPLGSHDGRVLAGLTAVWLFAHFTLYLVVWSANLPEQVRWSLARDDGFGGILEGAALVIAVLAITGGLIRTGPRFLAAVAALLALIHAAEWFWLVVPTSRNGLRFTAADGIGLIVAAGLFAGAGLWPRGRTSPQGVPNGSL